MHLKVLWKPQRGTKQSHPSYTNASLRWYVIGDAGQDVLEYSGAEERLVRELEEFGVLVPRTRNGARGYDTLEREIVRTAAELSRFGVAARNLRVLRSSADREAVLIEQILGPQLRSRNRDRRREAVDALESLAGVVSQLKHLMLVRDLRKLVQE